MKNIFNINNTKSKAYLNKILSFYIKITFVLIISISNINNASIGITHELSLQLGDNIAVICLAKILSLKYNVPFLYNPVPYSDIFVFDETEKRFDPNLNMKKIKIDNEQNISSNINANIIFSTDLWTRIDHIDPAYILEIKKMLQLKKTPLVNEIPNDRITIAVHIRKGNGGGEYYDGKQRSEQLFTFDKSFVRYINNYYNYPFDWPTYTRSKIELPSKNNINNIQPNIADLEFLERSKNPKTLNIDHMNTKYTNPLNSSVDSLKNWETKFPPEQYYVDQIKKISSDLNNSPLYVQIFTDDKNPKELTARIENAVGLSNIIFHYENNQSESFRRRIIEDLHSMSRFDVLIRSQSYFARIAELIGNHKVIIYPLDSYWLGKKLIMHSIVIKGDIQNLFSKN